MDIVVLDKFIGGNLEGGFIGRSGTSHTLASPRRTGYLFPTTTLMAKLLLGLIGCFEMSNFFIGMLKNFTVNIRDQGCNWLIAGVMVLSGKRVSKIVYPYFMDNFRVDGSEHVTECCLFYISSDFKITFASSNILDGLLGCQLSEAIYYIVAYHVNIAFDREGNDFNVTMTNFIWDPFPVVQANKTDLSLQLRIYAKEEWTERGTTDTINILISYLWMFAYACITLTDNLCLSSSYNSLLLNIWTDWEFIVCLKEKFLVPQKNSFSLIEFRLLWRFATGMFALVRSFTLLLIASKRWQAWPGRYAGQILMAFELINLLWSTKSCNDQGDWSIPGALDHIFSSSHKPCYGIELIDWEVASIIVLDSNLEDKVLIRMGVLL